MSTGWRLLLNGVLFSLLVAVSLSSWFLRGNSARTNYEFLPDMAHSPRYSAYAQNPNFPDGKTMQSPPAGSIARGHAPLHYSATQADAFRAGEELVNPLGAGSENSLQRGAKVFANFCAVCHGSDAAGLGPVAQRGFPPPPSLLLPHAVQMKDGQIFHVLTFGQNNMPSYASQLSPQDRWNVIVYVRSLQAPATNTLKAEQAGAPAPTGGGQ